MLEIYDYGVLDGPEDVEATIHRHAIEKVTIAHVDEITHWWVVIPPDGEKIVYYGNPKTFAKWRKRYE